MESTLGWVSVPAQRAEHEYSLQHVGVPPDALRDGISHRAVISVEKSVAAACAACKTQFGDIDQVDSAFEKVKELYVEQTEKTFFKFGEYIRKNLVSIPKHVVLPEDKGMEEATFFEQSASQNNRDWNDIDTSRKDVTKQSVAESLKKFNELCGKLKEAHVEAAVLEAQEKQLEDALAAQKKFGSKVAQRVDAGRGAVLGFRADCERNDENILSLNNMLDQI